MGPGGGAVVPHVEAPPAHATPLSVRERLAMHDPKWCIFFDFHTMPACPDVGANFAAEAIADQLASCGVDYDVITAKCNLGMA